MSGEEAVLALLLDGPMQAWGVSSRFGRRTTLAYPTRSGVTGLLCAAMGVERSDRATLEGLAGLSMEVLVIRRSEARRWTDYHTVGAAYDRDSQGGFIPTTAKDGRPRRDAVVTEREYLSDTVFGVLLSGVPDLLERCIRGLGDPRWGVWLGRKCCVPSDMVGQGIHPSRAAAIAHLEKRTGGVVVRLAREVDRFEDGTDTLLDMPIDFSIQDPSQRNAPRRVWVGAPDELREDP